MLIAALNRHLFFFFFNDTATTEIYTLSLHDALPIYRKGFDSSGLPFSPDHQGGVDDDADEPGRQRGATLEASQMPIGDRKSTRLNSSHDQISYAVFCLKKKNDSSAYVSRPDALTSAA